MSEIQVEAQAPQGTQDPPTEAKPTLGRAQWAAILSGAFFVLVAALIWGLNYFIVNRPLQRVLVADSRNQSVRASAHWGGWVDPNEVVFNITGLTGEASRIDVFRVLLQYAQALKDQSYSRVILASKGKAKFTFEGSYFHELGVEYSSQNPMYTIRVFPTRVSTMDGIHPYHNYGGGLLAVLGAEMQQFTAFSDEWYLNDFKNSLTADLGSSSETKIPEFDPCSGVRESDPHCGWKAHWDITGPSINKMDGAKTEFLSMDSIDPDGQDYGRLHYAELKLCFRNGKLCSGNSIAVGITVHGMLESISYDSEYSTAVRVRLDDDGPARQRWGISDDHEALFPYGREKQFASQLLQHKKLFVEFSYYQKVPRTVSFDLSGLDEALKSKGLAL